MNASDRYRAIDVPVRGGPLRVGIWEPVSSQGVEVPTILAIHGISSSHRAFNALADRLADYRIVAPDLRGRGRSNELPGPYGMTQHADDVAAVLDFLAIAKALVVGHSMGGFVAVVFTQRHANRTSGLLLIDGGIPLAIPEGVEPEVFAAAFLSSVSQRLEMTFPDAAAYRAYNRAHPAFSQDWNDAIVDYVDYDLVGQPPELRPATSLAALAEDSVSQSGSDPLAALEQIPSPTILLRAPRGFLNDEPGLWPPAWAALWQRRIPALDVRDVAGVNHYTILFNEAGLAAVAAAVHESLGRRAP